jgi:hypothetical protein
MTRGRRVFVCGVCLRTNARVQATFDDVWRDYTRETYSYNELLDAEQLPKVTCEANSVVFDV